MQEPLIAATAHALNVISTVMPPSTARDQWINPQTMSRPLVQNNTQSIEAEHSQMSRHLFLCRRNLMTDFLALYCAAIRACEQQPKMNTHRIAAQYSARKS